MVGARTIAVRTGWGNVRVGGAGFDIGRTMEKMAKTESQGGVKTQ